MPDVALKVTTSGDEREVPHGVTLEGFAGISAALAEGDRSLDDVLSAHGLSEATWEEVQAHHLRAIAADAMLSDEALLSKRYAELFAGAQDTIKPVPEMTPEEWAALILDVADRGGAAFQARGLTKSDYFRLARHWAKQMSGDRALAKRYAAAANMGAKAADR